MSLEKKEKGKLLNTHIQDGKVNGYTFQDDSYANQMAYLFGGKEGEEAAKKILDDAENKYPENPELNELDKIVLKQKKAKYIEEEIKKRAQEVDSKFHAGIKEIFQSLSNKEHPAKGEEAGKDAMLHLMKGLGLNVDDDNVQTHYTPGPPQVFQITWVNRPTANLADENSNINKLTNMYSNCLRPQEKEQFDNNWNRHVEHAKTGGPKIEKEEFLKQADQSFQHTIDALKNPEEAQKSDLSFH
ncbi:hypothetical protein ACTAZI_12015 [Legionella bozemanae]|uniref:hypothetical protein n=1 Tax=Legionella bozemanae TaxID=447 RepID=UPI00399C8D25